MKPKLESLESRELLAADVALVDGILNIDNGDTAVEVYVDRVGSQVTVDTVETLEGFTSFEDLNGDGSDATDFTIGDVATFSGGVAGTRDFPPGYSEAAYAWITVGESTIDFAVPADEVSFQLKDIVELDSPAEEESELAYDGLGTCTIEGLTDQFDHFLTMDFDDSVADPAVIEGTFTCTTDDSFELTSVQYDPATRVIDAEGTLLGSGQQLIVSGDLDTQVSFEVREAVNPNRLGDLIASGTSVPAAVQDPVVFNGEGSCQVINAAEEDLAFLSITFANSPTPSAVVGTILCDTPDSFIAQDANFDVDTGAISFEAELANGIDLIRVGGSIYDEVNFEILQGEGPEQTLIKFGTVTSVVTPPQTGVEGTLTLVTESGQEIDIEAPNKWMRFNSLDYTQERISQIRISNLDANGEATGVTNIDEFYVRARAEGSHSFRHNDVDMIFASLGGGDDYFENRTKETTVVFGGSGNDILLGGGGMDALFGQDGDDILYAGHDKVRDILDGGLGYDVFLADNMDTIMDDDSDAFNKRNRKGRGIR